MKPIATKVLLILIGLFMGLVACEVISRIFYTEPWYDRLVNEQLRNGQISSVTLNSLGLRDRDYSSIKPPNVKRILILGESFSYGWGVADDSAVYPRRLEQELNAEYKERGITIEVLNGGIPASLTGDWVNLLEKVKDSFQPDVILIVFFLRDGTRLASITAFFNPIRDEIVTQNQNSWLYQYSYTYRLLKDSRDRLYISDKYAKALTDSYLGTEQQTEEWVIAKNNLLKINSIGATMHAKVGFVVYPVLVQLDDSYPFAQIEKLVRDFGSDNGIPTFDLLPAFMGKNGPDLWVSPYDQHPNATAHAIVAKAILPFVEQLLNEQ